MGYRGGPTKAQKLANYDAVVKERDLLQQALTVIAQGAPVADKIVRHEDTVVHLELYKHDGAAGGLVVETYASRRGVQRYAQATVRVVLLEEGERYWAHARECCGAAALGDTVRMHDAYVVLLQWRNDELRKKREAGNAQP